MRRFESIVMSETEPITQGTLWLKPIKNTLGSKGPQQYSIWYFGEKGWTPISDFDTRYNINSNIVTNAVTDNPLVSSSTPNMEHGIVENDLTLHVYNGESELDNNVNLVTEKGLKVINDNIKAALEVLQNDIMSNINALESRVTALES